MKWFKRNPKKNPCIVVNMTGPCTLTIKGGGGGGSAGGYSLQYIQESATKNVELGEHVDSCRDLNCFGCVEEQQ